MKRTVSILLLFAVLLASLGVQVIFTLRTRQIRSEMKQLLKNAVPAENLHSFYFKTESEPDWVREGKEFKVEDRFYDVVSKEVVNGQVHYLCINDVEETALFAGLGEWITGHLQHDKKTQQSIQLLQQLTFFISLKSHASDLLSDLPTIVYSPYEFSVKQVDLKLDTPPPNNS